MYNMYVGKAGHETILKFKEFQKILNEIKCITFRNKKCFNKKFLKLKDLL